MALKALTLCGDFVLSLHTMWIALVPPLVSELHCLLTHALLCLCVCCTCDPITFDPALSCCQVPLSFHRFFCGCVPVRVFVHVAQWRLRICDQGRTGIQCKGNEIHRHKRTLNFIGLGTDKFCGRLLADRSEPPGDSKE
jgi:hypothetical protein